MISEIDIILFLVLSLPYVISISLIQFVNFIPNNNYNEINITYLCEPAGFCSGRKGRSRRASRGLRSNTSIDSPHLINLSYTRQQTNSVKDRKWFALQRTLEHITKLGTVTILVIKQITKSSDPTCWGSPIPSNWYWLEILRCLMANNL